MIVTIVTPVFNCVEFIADCINSIRSQTYPHIEHLIVDGGSEDGTLQVISDHKHPKLFIISEPDLGIYDAINKGIKLSKGEILGVLNADDFLAGKTVISSIVSKLKSGLYDAVYGNLVYTKRNDISTTSRRWEPGHYFPGKIRSGWTPPHPTLYLRRKIVSRVGLYSIDFGCSGDYEFILRVFNCPGFKPYYLNRTIIFMREGGMSNGSIKKMLRILQSDYLVLKKSAFRWPVILVAIKKIRKASQLFSR